MTTLSVLQMSAAHCSANCVSCGVALREAKNATNSLSSKSLFPDKSIKKRRRCINLSLIKALAAHYKNKQHKRPRRKYIAHTEPIGGKDIQPNGTFCCRSPCSSKPPSFDKEESSKNIQSNMYGSTAKAISHYKDKQNLQKLRILVENYFVAPQLPCRKNRYLWGKIDCNVESS